MLQPSHAPSHLVLHLLAIGCGTATTGPAAQGPDLPPQVRAAVAALHAQHDLTHRAVFIYTDRDSGFSCFPRQDWMGALEPKLEPGIVAWGPIFDACTDNPCSPPTCIRISLPALPASHPWAALAWCYPDVDRARTVADAWGHDLRKYQVPGETPRLVFKARGSGRVRVHCGGTPKDTFMSGALTIDLDNTWHEHSLALPNNCDLASVASGMVVDVERAWTPCTVFLDDIALAFGPQGTARRLAEPRFVPSFVAELPGEPDRHFRNACYLYDNALIVLALCAVGRAEDLEHARLICEAMVYVQEHEPEQDGRLRNAYLCGDLEDAAAGTEPRRPGWWDDAASRWFQDSYALETDTGNMAWAAIALLSYWRHTGSHPDSKYLRCARRACEWIWDHARSGSELGGYTGGEEIASAAGSTDPSSRPTAVPRGLPSPESRSASRPVRIDSKPVTWKSTEHNLDTFVAFSRLSLALQDPKWLERASHAKTFISRLLVTEGGFTRLCTGTYTDKQVEHIRREPRPLDVAPWSVLALREPERYAATMTWAQARCGVSLSDGTLFGYDFAERRILAKEDERTARTDPPGIDTRPTEPADPRGIWWEGTGQMAVAWKLLGDERRWRDSVRCLREHGHAASSGAAILATNVPALHTGFDKGWGSWNYYRRAHLGGATCWYVFAELGWNPFWDEPVRKR